MLHPTDEVHGRYVEAYLQQLEADIERVEQRSGADRESYANIKAAHVSSEYDFGLRGVWNALSNGRSKQASRNDGVTQNTLDFRRSSAEMQNSSR